MRVIDQKINGCVWNGGNDSYNIMSCIEEFYPTVTELGAQTLQSCKHIPRKLQFYVALYCSTREENTSIQREALLKRVEDPPMCFRAEES